MKNGCKDRDVYDEQDIIDRIYNGDYVDSSLIPESGLSEYSLYQQLETPDQSQQEPELELEPQQSEFSFQRYLDSDEGKFYDITKTNLFINNNPDVITKGLEFNDPNVDIFITYSFSDSVSFGISSGIYEAFECYLSLKNNSLPPELGGPNIKLGFFDYCVTEEGFSTKTDLGPNKNYGNEVLKAIFTKYDGSKKILKELENDLIFLNKPKAIKIKKHQLPYTEYSRPSDIVIIDGVSKSSLSTIMDLKLSSDNLHMYISDKIGFPEELHNHFMEDVNFICLYQDNRLDAFLPEIHSQRIFKYNDVKRISFRAFKKESKYLANPPKKERPLDYGKRYCLFLTQNSRAITKCNDKYSTVLLDDIIDSIRLNDLNPIGRKIRDDRELFKKNFIELSKSKIQNIESTISELKTKIDNNTAKEIQRLTEKLKEANDYKNQLKVHLENKKLFENTKYNLDEIMIDGNSVHFVIIGLPKDQMDFEAALIHRCLQRGINITTEFHALETLPLTEIHSLYDIYLYTPTINNWDAQSRFLPESLYYGKKIKYTKLAQKNLHDNYGLLLRLNDTEKHLDFITEGDVFGIPKMQLTLNLLGYWPNEN